MTGPGFLTTTLWDMRPTPSTQLPGTHHPPKSCPSGPATTQPWPKPDPIFGWWPPQWPIHPQTAPYLPNPLQLAQQRADVSSFTTEPAAVAAVPPIHPHHREKVDIRDGETRIIVHREKVDIRDGDQGTRRRVILDTSLYDAL